MTTDPGPSPTPTLLLIHGMGADAGVWAGVTARLDWPGRVVVPDLAGHGRAPWTGDYTLGAFAAGVSAHCDRGEPTVVVGHSLGGAVGLALASGWFRPRVTAVLGLGIKVSWSDDDVTGMAAVAGRGIRWFDTEAEAADRFLRVAGLAGVTGPDGPVGSDHPAVATGITRDDGVEGGGRWRLSQDPATFAQSPPDMAHLLAAARSPVVLGAGGADAMVPTDDLLRYRPDPVTEPVVAPGRGHNVQVEDPDWVIAQLWALVDR